LHVRWQRALPPLPDRWRQGKPACPERRPVECGPQRRSRWIHSCFPLFPLVLTAVAAGVGSAGGGEDFLPDQHAIDVAGASAVMVSPAIQVARCAAYRIALAASLRKARTAAGVCARSQAWPTAYTYALQACMLAYMSASLACTSWNSPIACPNCLRS